jgi:hypothetical protein
LKEDFEMRAAFFAFALVLAGCGKDGSTEPSTCDAECLDQTAMRSVRETLKLVYNLTLQGKPVGAQDETTRCPQGGNAHVFGDASSVAEQGATNVDLTYELKDCAYLQKDDEPDESYDVAISGAITQSGVIAVQPTSTTALLFEGADVSVRGTLFDPAYDYAEEACALSLSQSGNHLAGKFCERSVAFDL